MRRGSIACTGEDPRSGICADEETDFLIGGPRNRRSSCLQTGKQRFPAMSSNELESKPLAKSAISG